MKNKYTILAGCLITIATVYSLVMASALWSYQPKTLKCFE